jgi:hypothetical protein
MKLNNRIIDSISKKLRTGVYARLAAESEGIDESTFYRWKKQGEKILDSITDKNDEINRSLWKSLTKTQKLKCKFYQSVQQSTAQGHAALVAMVYSKASEDWRAAMELLARRFPRDWGRKDHLHLEAEVEEKPNRLKELEEKYLADIPESKIKDIAKTFMEAVEAAKVITSKKDKKIE